MLAAASGALGSKEEVHILEKIQISCFGLAPLIASAFQSVSITFISVQCMTITVLHFITALLNYNRRLLHGIGDDRSALPNSFDFSTPTSLSYEIHKRIPP